MSSEYKLIPKPDGGGSSTTVLDTDLFYIHKGIYGGKRVTIISFRISQDYVDYCFEGNVDFKDENEVYQTLTDLVPYFIPILISMVTRKSYNNGLGDGRREVQIALRGIIGC